MKSNVMPSIVIIEPNELNELMTTVKETLAMEYLPNGKATKQRGFGVIDLWNCRKNMRTARTLRRL